MTLLRRIRARVHSLTAVILIGLVPLPLSGCSLLEDNGTHLAFALEAAAAKLRASSDRDSRFSYTTLDGGSDPYAVEITPSHPDPSAAGHPQSYIVVSGKTPGGTSYHNRFVVVPTRLSVRKDRGGATEIVLRKDGDQIAVVDLR